MEIFIGTGTCMGWCDWLSVTLSTAAVFCSVSCLIVGLQKKIHKVNLEHSIAPENIYKKKIHKKGLKQYHMEQRA